MSRTVLYSHTDSRDVVHTAGVFFQCDRCRRIKPVQTNGGTGYASRDDDRLVCYACCGQTDRLAMIETGKAVLYATYDVPREGCKSWKVTNWPGTLTFRVGSAVHYFRHPFARHAMVLYFTGPDGKPWSAKNIGDSQIAHCRRLAR